MFLEAGVIDFFCRSVILMECLKENTIRGLKEIIQNCQLAENHLRISANDSGDTSIMKIFYYYADLNSSYIKKLKNEILRLGGDLDDDPDEKLLCAQEPHNYNEELKNCENSIKVAVDNYKKFSSREDILNEVIPIIFQQYFGEIEVQEIINNIKSQEMKS
jgi:hypothetical protein